MKDKKRIERDITAIKTCITNYEADLAEAEKKLTESIRAATEKPLQHGDYGINNKQSGLIVKEGGFEGILRTADKDYLFSHETVSENAYTPKLVLGNIFDDLKALSEPLTEFVIQSTIDSTKIHCGWWGDKRGLRIRQGEKFIVIHKDYLPEFILNLRRMQAKKG